MKKWLIIMLAVGILSLVIALFVYPMIMEELESRQPSVKITGIEFDKISFTQVTVTAGIALDNQNAVGATLDRIEYDIFYGNGEEWIKLGHGERGTLSIRGKAVTEFEVTSVIENSQILGAFIMFLSGGGEPQVKVDGTAWFDFWIFSVGMPFEEVITITDLGDMFGDM